MVSQAVKKAGMIIGVFFALQLVFTLMITIAAALPRGVINQHLQESEATPPLLPFMSAAILFWALR